MFVNFMIFLLSFHIFNIFYVYKQTKLNTKTIYIKTIKAFWAFRLYFLYGAEQKIPITDILSFLLDTDGVEWK